MQQTYCPMSIRINSDVEHTEYMEIEKRHAIHLKLLDVGSQIICTAIRATGLQNDLDVTQLVLNLDTAIHNYLYPSATGADDV